MKTIQQALEKASTKNETVRLEIEVPRSALVTVAAPAEYVSQLNVEREFGIDSRRYLDIINEPGSPLEVIRVGKLRLVHRAALADYLRTRERTSTRRPAPDGLDDLREELGLVAGGAK